MDFSSVGTAKKKAVSAPPPAKAPLLDLEAAKQRFAWVNAELDRMEAEAKALVVNNEETLSRAVAMAGQAKVLGKKIQGEEDRILEKPEGYVKSVKGFVKLFTERLISNPRKTNPGCLEAILKKKITDYQFQQELDRREQERKAREAADKLQADLNRQAEEKGVAPVEVPTPVLPKAQTVARAETGAAAHLRRTWKGQVVAPDKVPREYCSPDQKKINEAVGAGIRSIEGVNIYEDIDSVIRT